MSALQDFSSLHQRIGARIGLLQNSGLYRKLQTPRGADLCSNDYLQLANDPRLKARMAEAVLAEGCGSTGSRLLRGERACFSAIEQRFAQWKGTEAALYFSTGYAANLAVLSTFLEDGDVVFFDRLNHASLIDGMKLGKAKKIIFPHADVNALQQYMDSVPAERQKFLVTESVFSMDGDLAPLQEYARMCRETGTALILDEAHAVGVYGTRGAGLAEEAGIEKDVFLSINSAGKALGVSGAFVAGPAWAIDYLIQGGRTFLFSTAPPPAVAGAIDAALDVIDQEPERRVRLHQLSGLLRAKIADAGIVMERTGSQILPVFIGENDRAVKIATTLQAEGFDVRAIRPPTVPEGTARLRLSVNVGLSEAILDRFVEQLVDALKNESAK